MKPLFFALITALVLLGCEKSFDNDDSLENVWAQVDANRARKEATAIAAGLSATDLASANLNANVVAVGGNGKPVARKAPDITAKTGIERAALAAAGTSVARALLLKQWHPKRIVRLGTDAAAESRACADNDALLVRYDHGRDALQIDQESCWSEESSQDENLRYQAAYLAGISAAAIAAQSDVERKADLNDALRVKVMACESALGFALGVTDRCEQLADPPLDGSTPASLTADQMFFIQSTATEARRCADAIVAANAKTIRALAKKLTPELRASAKAAWDFGKANDDVPPRDAFDFPLPEQLTAFRKTHRLTMPSGRKYRDLPAYCAAPR